MKKVKISILMVLAVVLILPACKKGADDPFLSLKSRKARISGVWTLSSGTRTETQGGSTYTATYDGSLVHVTYSGLSQSQTYTEKITVNKDGSFEDVTNDDGTLSDVKGSWYFGRKDKTLDLKNKESVVFIETSVVTTQGSSTTTQTYTGAACPSYTAILDELKSKEMKIKLDGSDTGTSTTTDTGMMTYTKN